MKRPLLLLGVLGLVGMAAFAHDPSAKIDFYLAVDVPADLPLPAGSTTVLPWTLARHRTAFAPPYTLDLSPASPLPLPLPASVDACHLLTSGNWLFSVEVPLDDPAGSATRPSSIPTDSSHEAPSRARSARLRAPRAISSNPRGCSGTPLATETPSMQARGA